MTNIKKYTKVLSFHQAQELKEKAPETVVFVYYRNANHRDKGEDYIKRFSIPALYHFGDLEIIVTENVFNQYFS